MALRLKRGLWLWAGIVAWGLISVFPLHAWVRALALLVVAGTVAAAWMLAGRRSSAPITPWVQADTRLLPPAAYRQPVVLVCGDGLPGLFGAMAAEQLALRTTARGCYVRVPSLEQLPAVVAGITAMRPLWAGQLSVLFVVNPAEHTDGAVLAGLVRAFSGQLARVRTPHLALPLLIVSYLQASRGAGPWFAWHAGRTSPDVCEGVRCASLAEWQQQTTDTDQLATRLHASVQLNNAAAWFKDAVLSHCVGREPGGAMSLALGCAITLVPALPHAQPGNLWQQRLRDKVALANDGPLQAEGVTPLPFPDALLHLLPVHGQDEPLRRASKLAMWLFTVGCVAALASSAWQNTLLVRQVTDDLRRYMAIAPSVTRGQSEFAQREEAVEVLRQDARRLDDYYRHGEPLALGLGLYRGEYLREQVQAAIASHRQPTASSRAIQRPNAVRLDSLSLFSPGSAQLKPDATKVLISALVDIKAQPDGLIVIAGHTDTTGSSEQNLKLSRARAAAVHDWIQRMGDLPHSCFAVQGFGATQPIASNDTEAGRALNRRVDIRLVPEVGACVPAVVPGKQPPVASRDIHYLREGASHGYSRLPVAER